MKLRKFLAAATALTLLLGIAATPEVGSEIKLALTAHAESGEIPIDAAHFPDEIFRQSILDELDTDKNGSLSTEEAAVATSMQCQSEGITSLKGIEYFTELTLLDCSNNQLTELDVSKNTALTYLSCNSNLLTELDVSGCTSLDFLNCLHNSLEELDVRECAVLKHLYCNSNQFTELDVSKNILLEDLDCCDNKIIELDISNCPNIILAYTTGEDANVWNYPYGVFGKLYKENGSIRYTIYADEDTKITTEPKADGVAIDEINFPDENFRAYVSENFDTDNDGKLSTQEIYVVDSIYVARKNIISLKGVEYFTALKKLTCEYNSLTELDLSSNTALTELFCNDNQLVSLNVGNNTYLEQISCGFNQLTELDVSGCKNLIYLACPSNLLVELDLSNNAGLERLVCHVNKLNSLNLNGCISLQQLWCQGNQLTDLDISDCISLNDLECAGNQIESLDISKNPMLLNAYNSGKTSEYDDSITYGDTGGTDDGYLYVDKTTNIITEKKQQEIGTADVSGMQNNTDVDITQMGITFEDDSGKTYTAQVQSDGKIMLPSLPAGVYNVTASLENCPSRDYTVTVESGKPIELDVELKLYGDLNGDGILTVFDVMSVNKCAQKTGSLDGYDYKVADVTNDNNINVFDCMKINAHIKKTTLMW